MASFDVVAVTIAEPHLVRLIATGRDRTNAEAIVKMTVARRGVTDEFYCEVPAHSYQGGDLWAGPNPGAK